MSEKHATYQKLQEILQELGCPICHIGQAAGRKYLDILLFESVNDPGIRKQLEASLGFCYYHSHELLTFPGSRLGVGIIERHMLKISLDQLQQSPTPSRRSFFAKWERSPTIEKTPCPACLQAQAAEERATGDLLKHLIDDLDQPLADAGGLCLRHIQQALFTCRNRETYRALIQIHEPLWQEQIAFLDEFIRKHDYRYRHEGISKMEGASVERSIDILMGEYPLSSLPS